MKISFVGSGNIAHHLAKAAHAKGVEIVQIISRKLEHAAQLADLVNAKSSDSLSDLNSDVDFVLLAINDDSIEQVAHELSAFKTPLVHTAGSVNIDLIKNKEQDYGVLYPLQTFSKTKVVEIAKVPFFIEASSDKLFQKLQQFTERLGAVSYKADSTQRLNLHIAAVFACNFSNNMYQIAKDLLDKHNLPFEALKPLIIETANKIETLDPKAAQTGPAKRNDTKTMQKHLDALRSNEALYELYKAISENIQKSGNS